MKTNLKHGMYGSPTYRSWANMTARCLYEKSPGYRYYGGRGITVCERWRSFENFLSDMGERPLGKTIDRIDGSKGYEPGNCRWATAAEQRKNQSTLRKPRSSPRTKPATKRRGRPPIPAKDRATKQVHFRCTAAEKASYRKKAKEHGIGLSAWIKRLAEASSIL